MILIKCCNRWRRRGIGLRRYLSKRCNLWRRSNTRKWTNSSVRIYKERWRKCKLHYRNRTTIKFKHINKKCNKSYYQWNKTSRSRYHNVLWNKHNKSTHRLRSQHPNTRNRRTRRYFKFVTNSSNKSYQRVMVRTNN